MNEKIEKDLLEYQDIKYRDFQKKLGLGNLNMIGVRTPILRKYAKELLKNNYLEYLNNPSDKYFETILLEGFLIAGSKICLEEKIKYLDKFIYKIDNWATCDLVCSSFKFKDNELDDMFKYLEKYKKSKDEFVVRFITVMMLNHYLNDKYIDKVLLLVDNLNTGKYYIDMAIGWLLSFVFIKYRDKFDNFMNKTKLDSNIKKIAYRKIIESNKVSVDDKKKIKTNCLF